MPTMPFRTSTGGCSPCRPKRCSSQSIRPTWPPRAAPQARFSKQPLAAVSDSSRRRRVRAGEKVWQELGRKVLPRNRGVECWRCGLKLRLGSDSSACPQGAALPRPSAFGLAGQVEIQEENLARRRGVPGCPLVFATVNGVHLATPSLVSKQRANEDEAATQRLPEHERAAEPLLRQGELEALRGKPSTSVRFRKNRAKGPNPLAVKRRTAANPERGDKGRRKEGAERGQGAAAAAGASPGGTKRKAEGGGGDGGGKERQQRPSER
ncbi:hypothetical protein TSOC_005749 [Tetrabaena socialis]|uniref:UTP23 sensor motif region domain-containing protein n=1 Tax=Tetrabaena socialis TaxID=47790 RepID=A0A2J8A5J2_9CHLO|nr:hypothetical protein TSOC_005749 [Tetrabaena socialis]|eukprot:PNH07775.1 hypothetical protein TSOC_005749 [Tetrabaena socialis]